MACKKDYYHFYFESNIGKVKATWNGINSVLHLSRKKTKTQVPKLVIGDKDINDPLLICTTFNSYFTEIGPTLGLAPKINPQQVSFRYFITPSHTNFELIASTVDEESKLVANLPTSKADGLDRIPARLPKASCPFTAASLANVL